METLEKLQKVYDYYVQMMTERKKYFGKNVDYIIDKHGNKVFKTEALFIYINKLFGHDDKPKIVSQEEFDNLETLTVYHGYRKAEHARNYLCDTDHHAGSGHYGSGFYVSDNARNATTYTVEEYKLDAETKREHVTKFKVSNDAIMIDIAMLLKNAFNAIGRGDKDALKFIAPGQYNRFKKVKDFIKSIPEDDEYKYDFIDAFFMDDPSCFATVLGYDIINVGNRIDTVEDHQGRHLLEKCNQYIVLSRNTLIVSENEKQRMERLAEKEPTQRTDRFIVVDEKE